MSIETARVCIVPMNPEGTGDASGSPPVVFQYQAL